TFNDDVFAFDESILSQSFDEGRTRRGDRNCRIVGRKADPIYFSALLRARRQRPCGCRAAEQRDERAALHSITSSASASSLSGIWRPRALAVLRLMTSSNLVA